MNELQTMFISGAVIFVLSAILISLKMGRQSKKSCTHFGGESHRWEKSEDGETATCADCGMVVKRKYRWEVIRVKQRRKHNGHSIS